MAKDEALPFGVGGGLVAIKTLLGRDPCVHANTAIEMIDAILSAHAQPAPVQPVAGLYAVLFANNWDGEGDQEYVFAELSEDGVWTRYENGSLLFEYKGDKIISAWPLSEATQPAAQPAPVQQVAATITISRRGAVNTIDNHFEDCVRDWPDGEYKLVLATPPAAQRQWVGLTQEERLHFLNEILDYGTGFVAPLDSVIWSIEAKLKEKNA
jgi:hypothetical protein